MQALAVVTFLAAICVFFLPSPHMAPPAMKMGAAPEFTVNEELHLSYDHAYALFDHSVRPPEPTPTIAEPVVDPAAAISSYRLFGVTLHEDGAIALLFDGDRTFNLKEGDILEGFSVSNIEARRIEFRQGEIIAVLELPAASD